MYLGVQSARPDLLRGILGCHITEESARFDFSSEQRITADEVTAIAAFADDLARRNLPVEMSAHADEPQARYWKCGDFVIPCGGTHADNSGRVGGGLEVRRRGLGRNKERLRCAFPHAEFNTEAYHEKLL